MKKIIPKEQMSYRIVLDFPIEVYLSDFTHILDLMKKFLLLTADENNLEITIIEDCDHITKQYLPENYFYEEKEENLKTINALSIKARNTARDLSMTLHLNHFSSSHLIIAQSKDEIWIRGSTIELKKFLETKKANLRAMIKNTILKANTFIFFILVGILPSLSLKLRLSIITFFILMVILNKEFYNTLTYSIISPQQKKPMERIKNNPIVPATLNAIISAGAPIILYNISGMLLRIWNAILKFMS